MKGESPTIRMDPKEVQMAFLSDAIDQMIKDKKTIYTEYLTLNIEIRDLILKCWQVGVTVDETHNLVNSKMIGTLNKNQ